MDNLRLTHERLRTSLNGDQPSRERMCLAVLALNRNYTDAQPRRPEGGPDGGHDIRCFRNSQLCFGAVGFLNNVSDSPADKRAAKKKFKSDLEAALNKKSDLHAFVFFTNVDLTPSEVDELSKWGKSKGVSFIDIYWREVICQTLNSAEGLAIRYQYLGIPLSEAEQSAFFNRFGTELEQLVKGRFDSLEQKIEYLTFEQWKRGAVREIRVELSLAKREESERDVPEHFRVMFQLYNRNYEHYSLLLGGRDNFWSTNDGTLYFSTKTFVSSFKKSKIETQWLERPRTGGPPVHSLEFAIRWPLGSHIPVEALSILSHGLYITENLITRIASLRLIIDSYVILDKKLRPVLDNPNPTGLNFGPTGWQKKEPPFEWPGPLTAEESQLAWYCDPFIGFRIHDPLSRVLPRVD